MQLSSCVGAVAGAEPTATAGLEEMAGTTEIFTAGAREPERSADAALEEWTGQMGLLFGTVGVTVA